MEEQMQHDGTFLSDTSLPMFRELLQHFIVTHNFTEEQSTKEFRFAFSIVHGNRVDPGQQIVVDPDLQLPASPSLKASNGADLQAPQQLATSPQYYPPLETPADAEPGPSRGNLGPHAWGSAIGDYAYWHNSYNYTATSAQVSDDQYENPKAPKIDTSSGPDASLNQTPLPLPVINLTPNTSIHQDVQSNAAASTTRQRELKVCPLCLSRVVINNLARHVRAHYTIWICPRHAKSYSQEDHFTRHHKLKHGCVPEKEKCTHGAGAVVVDETWKDMVANIPPPGQHYRLPNVDKQRKKHNMPAELDLAYMDRTNPLFHTMVSQCQMATTSLDRLNQTLRWPMYAEVWYEVLAERRISVHGTVLLANLSEGEAHRAWDTLYNFTYDESDHLAKKDVLQRLCDTASACGHGSQQGFGDSLRQLFSRPGAATGTSYSEARDARQSTDLGLNSSMSSNDILSAPRKRPVTPSTGSDAGHPPDETNPLAFSSSAPQQDPPENLAEPSQLKRRL